MPVDYGPVFWPAWNPKFGRDTDPADFPAHKSLQEIYADQRAWEKQRLADQPAQTRRSSHGK